jgi:sugar lactone lactonase YvrE
MVSNTRVIGESRGFPESPRWHGGKIWFTLSRQIMTCGLDGDMKTVAELDGPIVLGIAFFDDGSFLTANAIQRHLYRIYPDGTRNLFADLSGEVPDIVNESVIAPNGSVYVGTVGFNLLQGESARPSRLVRIAPSGSVSRVGPEMTMPNGMVISEDKSILYVAESFGAKITALAVHSDGSLEPHHTVADLSGRDVSHPDGIAVDRDGSIFYADVEAGLVVHIGADGAELERFSAILPHATSCALGGEDGRTLFVTATERMASPGAEQTQRSAIVAIDLPKR